MKVLLAKLFQIISYLARIFAWLLTGLCCVLCFSAFPGRFALSQLANTIASVLPYSISGMWVVACPFGGVFRGDFFISAILFFCIDWICMRIYQRLVTRVNQNKGLM